MIFTDGTNEYRCISNEDWIKWSHNQFDNQDDERMMHFLKDQINLAYGTIEIGNKRYPPYDVLSAIDKDYLYTLMDIEIESIGEHVRMMLELYGHCNLHVYENRTSKTIRTYRLIDKE